jgi:hypothetical protein
MATAFPAALLRDLTTCHDGKRAGHICQHGKQRWLANTRRGRGRPGRGGGLPDDVGPRRCAAVVLRRRDRCGDHRADRHHGAGSCRHRRLGGVAAASGRTAVDDHRARVRTAGTLGLPAPAMSASPVAPAQLKALLGCRGAGRGRPAAAGHPARGGHPCSPPPTVTGSMRAARVRERVNARGGRRRSESPRREQSWRRGHQGPIPRIGSVSSGPVINDRVSTPRTPFVRSRPTRGPDDAGPVQPSPGGCGGAVPGPTGRPGRAVLVHARRKRSTQRASWPPRPGTVTGPDSTGPGSLAGCRGDRGG